jgi:hypothetical protein
MVQRSFQNALAQDALRRMLNARPQQQRFPFVQPGTVFPAQQPMRNPMQNLSRAQKFDLLTQSLAGLGAGFAAQGRPVVGARGINMLPGRGAAIQGMMSARQNFMDNLLKQREQERQAQLLNLQQQKMQMAAQMQPFNIQKTLAQTRKAQQPPGKLAEINALQAQLQAMPSTDPRRAALEQRLKAITAPKGPLVNITNKKLTDDAAMTQEIARLERLGGPENIARAKFLRIRQIHGPKVPQQLIDSQRSYTSADNAIRGLAGMYQTGIDLTDFKQRSRADQYFSQLVNDIKTIKKMGANFTESEIKLVNKIIGGNPTKLSDKLLIGDKQMKENLGTLHNMLRREQQSMTESYLKPGEPIPPLNEGVFQLLSGKAPRNETLKNTEQMDPILRHHYKNIAGNKAVKNTDGSISTVFTRQVEINGVPTLIPSVWDGKILNEKDAIQRAITSGIKWPQAQSHKKLRAYDQTLHKDMKNISAEEARKILKRNSNAEGSSDEAEVQRLMDGP